MYRWLIAAVVTGLWLMPAMGQPASTASFDSAGGAAGLGFLKPGEWGLVRSRIRNDGAEAVELLSSVQFKEGDNIQFVTRAWVPPQSVREVLQPVYLHMTPRSDRAVDLSSLLIDTSRGEQMRGREDGLIRLEMDDRLTAVVADTDADDAISAVIAARLAAGASKRMAYVSPAQLPALPAVYDAITCLVFAHGDVELTPAQTHAIRSWICDGGRLWIMLDRVPAGLGPRLVGNDWPIAVIDRLPMTQLALRGSGSLLQRERDDPWDMVRVVAPRARVLHEAAGWPASLTFAVGKGAVVVTTLDAHAWWLASDKEGGDPQATEPLTELAVMAWGGAAGDVPIDASRFGEFVRDQIGYRILGRGPVIVVLALLPLAVIVSGLWLTRRHRLEVVGAIAVAGSVLLGAVLIGMGRAQRRTVPLTVASAQWVEVAPGQDMAAVKAAISIYSPEADRGPLSGNKGGVLWPDMTGQGGRQLRMVWTDLDHWSWEGLELPSGAVRSAAVRHLLPMERHAGVTLTFGPRGVQGRITPGPFEQFEDLVLATPVAAMAVRPDGDGTFVVQPSDQLQRGEYIAGATLGQQQRARQDMYRALLDRTNYPTTATLLTWAKSLDLGLELSIPATQHHSALVAMPATWTPAALGQRVAVPGAFVPFTVVRGEGGVGTTTLYSAITREWIDSAQGHTLLFRFRLPREVLPMTAEAATLTIQLSARDRVVEVLRVTGRQMDAVARLEGVAGTQRVSLKAADLSPVDADGGLIVGLRVHDNDDVSAGSIWRLIDIRLDVEGTVQTPITPGPRS